MFYLLSLSLVKHGILFTKFARVEFECMFSFVSLLFLFLNLNVFFELKKFI